MNFENKIAELRRSRGMSQEGLAEKMQVARQTISKWELGETAPDLAQAKKLSKIFDISIDELVGNTFTANGDTNDKGNILVKRIGLLFTDIFAGAASVLLLALSAVVALFGLCCVAAAVCLIFKIKIYGLIPQMPWMCGFIAAVALLALAVSALPICRYIGGFSVNLFKDYLIFRANTLYGRKDNYRNLLPALKQNERKLLFVSLITALVAILVTLAVCMLTAQSLQFWDKWQWWQ